MKMCWGIWRIASRILNLGIRWRFKHWRDEVFCLKLNILLRIFQTFNNKIEVFYTEIQPLLHCNLFADMCCVLQSSSISLRKCSENHKEYWILYYKYHYQLLISYFSFGNIVTGRVFLAWARHDLKPPPSPISYVYLLIEMCFSFCYSS
jgi:hypothetical protein